MNQRPHLADVLSAAKHGMTHQKRFPLLVMLLLGAISAPARASAGEEGLAKARSLLLAGKYAEAAEIYEPLAAKDSAVVLGLARSLEAQGKLDEAVKRLTAAAQDRAELHAELARLAFERGDYQQANARADETLRLDKNQLLAWWILAELDRTAGRLDEADRVYRRLVSFYNEHDVKQAESLRWIGLAAAQNARWNRVKDQFDFLVNELYPEALKLEPDYWPAHYEAGLLFLEKYNQADAARQFQAALKLNPNAAEVHAALARLAVAERDPKRAESALARALEINPRLPDAWLTKADLSWTNFQARETLDLLEKKALPLNPVHEETLGRMAACYLLLDGPPKPGEQTRFTRLVEQVLRRNPCAGEFFLTLGDQLETRSQLPEAERYLRESLRVMPRLVGPQSSLGLLYMRTGQEPEARKLLQQAFEIDPFNVRVKNSLSVLEVLDEMETLTTDRFVLRYDGKLDKLLGRYARRHLEATYPELCKRFGFQPPQKPLVEIFNRSDGIPGQQWFSTRMIGLPYLGPVAASTGHMLAMSSPFDPDGPRRLNWARVLRHELVHVVTLQQTRFNIPHWYTEGLAVWSEGYPPPLAWNELLLERVPRGKLFNLQTLNFGFTRPESSAEWHLAYCQAKLYVDYIIARSGEEALRKLLAAYTEGLATPEAIQRAVGIPQDEFERGYVEYLKKLVAGLSRLKEPSSAGLDELLKAQQERPKDADAAAELSYGYLRREAKKEALQMAEQALKLRPKHQLATYVVARLRLDASKTQEAAELLEGCLDEKSPQPNVLSLLAGLKLKAEEFDEAARLYSLGERLDCTNLSWTRALARMYLVTKNESKLTETLTRLANTDSDDVTVRKKLAQMALDRRDYPAAVDWANRALEIDVMDAEVHRLGGEAAAGRRDFPRAVEEFETAVELEPKDLKQRFALADACVQAKQPEKARQVLRALLKLKPDYPGADVLLETLEEMKTP